MLHAFMHKYRMASESTSRHPPLNPDAKYDHRYWRSFAKALLASTSHAVLELNSGGSVLRSNVAALQTFGLQPGSYLPDAAPGLWTRVRDAGRSDRDSTHGQIQLRQHACRLWATRIQPADDSRHILCVIEDRTELEEISHRMHNYQELNNELNAIIASSDDGLWVCDADGKVLRINAASERLNMIQAEDVLGRSMYDLQAEGFIDRSVTLKVLKTRRRQNILQRTRSGKKLILTGNPVFNEAGEMIRVVVNERDITDLDALTRKLKEQVAIRDKMRHQMLEMQLEEITAKSLIARSPVMVKVIQQALKLSQVKTTALIFGASGTGKGIIAKLIHKHSDRADNPMITINCGAIPENLVETELFGYQKGAFTGADQKGKAGHLELAHKGTLFLDEIAELPLSSQVKLLRFLENGRVARVGGTTSRTVDVRILCATHQDLDQLAGEGKFRRDLYYRLHVIPICIPPLRERKECIWPLIQHYIAHFGQQMGNQHKTHVSREAMDTLMAYPFPGNVRELINLCERLVVMTEGREITSEDLPDSVTSTVARSKDSPAGNLHQGETLAQMLAVVERRILLDAQKRYGSQARIAQALGVNQSTIARKLKKLGRT